MDEGLTWICDARRCPALARHSAALSGFPHPSSSLTRLYLGAFYVAKRLGNYG